MKTIGSTSLYPAVALTAIAASLLTMFSPVYGQSEMAARTDELRRDLATPESRVSFGLGALSGAGRRFGQYNGLHKDGAYGLFDLALVGRDEASGTWLKLKGRNLGLDNRELRFDHEQQGRWAYYLGVSQFKNREPLIVTTGLQGIGAARQTVSAVAPKRTVDLSRTYDQYSFGSRSFFGNGFDLRIDFRQDEKRGERLFGRGTPGTMEFLTEPIDRSTRQWDVVLGFANPVVQLSGGYSGSAFENRIPRLDIVGGSAAAFGAAPTPLNVMALPPGNQAHRLHLAGGYNASGSLRTTFKASYSVARQNEAFIQTTPTFAGSRGSLEGKVATSLFFADVTARPMERLDLTASLRFEDQDDKTPASRFITAAAPSAAPGLGTAGVTGFNIPRSHKQLKGLVETGYRFDDGYRLVGALEQEKISRTIPVQYRRIGYREKTDETQARIELKRTLSETLNGSLAWVHSVRGGSDYSDDTYAKATSPTNQVGSLMWADRQRNKLRLTVDWLPAEQWSLQLIGDLADDRYAGRHLGPRHGRASFVSADLAYALSEKWKLGAWLSQERSLTDQSARSDLAAAAPNPNILWDARLLNLTSAWGFNLKGKPQASLELGVDLSAAINRSVQGIDKTGGVGTASPASLPDFYYRQLTLKLFADYALDPYSSVRGDLIYDRRRTDDWTWRNWVYSAVSDGTTLSQPPAKNTVFLGASYRYRFR